MRGEYWIAPADEALSRLVKADLLSYSLIAKEINREFGTKFTRCAAIGRAGRLGLRDPRVRRVPVHGLQPAVYGKPPAPSAPRVRKRKVHVMLALPKEYVLPNVAPRHVGLIELELGECRWPYGHGPFTFCACPVFSEAHPYCEAHTIAAHREVT
jgi:GcrA cell cycle regulator